MARSAEIFCFCVIVHTSHRRNGTLCGRNARRSRNVVDGHREGRFMVVGVVLHHLWELQPSDKGLRHGHADQSLAVSGHKVDVLRGGEFGGADEIALVFSRSGSSVTRMIFPCFRSSNASGMVLNFIVNTPSKAAAQQHFFCERVFASVFLMEAASRYIFQQHRFPN